MTDTTWLYDLEAEVDAVVTALGEVLDNAWIESMDDRVVLDNAEGMEMSKIITTALERAYQAGAAYRVVQ